MLGIVQRYGLWAYYTFPIKFSKKLGLHSRLFIYLSLCLPIIAMHCFSFQSCALLYAISQWIQYCKMFSSCRVAKVSITISFAFRS